ncbi:nitroreductase family protein [Legionella parisiensis]|uniref:Coenzyme F420:L-glutamate ligase n=2 Tax=Legionella parisiensis TaxID=45071 RepID=A0A1E5JPA1_9GAMM|nr:nitroreductase family protein [Legionella parisiensis]KTD40562.1 nitroreductase [Legionella parisiensis]OEH46183.1 Coenzyme F420:L-glutamate ligase [Legionella parisiensis]STX77045.1 nitroreductase [Legionella parisiensis]
MENVESINRYKIDVIDAIYNRRAVRNYLPQKVDSEIIHQLLDAATHAPSALHEESRGFVVIQNKSLLDRISESAKLLTMDNKKKSLDLQEEHVLKVVQQKEFNVFYNARTLIVIYSTFKGKFVSADCWLAAENLMLAALTYGLSSCVVGFAVPALNLPEWKKELEIPTKMTAVAPIILGWPSGNTLPTSHKPPLILQWR